MSHVKEMSNVLIDTVLLGNLRLFGFGFEEEKPKPPPEIVEVEPYVPPEPITLEKIKELNSEFGIIYTCFPENRGKEFVHLPESYFSLSPKEKLLLLFAENFRRQFKELFQSRRPLVLAVENECRVQKFVSTTIRPSTFVEFPSLIDDWQACAYFVADHILFEPLSNPTKLVST